MLTTPIKRGLWLDFSNFQIDVGSGKTYIFLIDLMNMKALLTMDKILKP